MVGKTTQGLSKCQQVHTFWCCDLTLRKKETEEKLAVSNFSNLAIKRFTADKIPSQSYNNFLDCKIFESIVKINPYESGASKYKISRKVRLYY